jgi:hypothetical protein
MVAFETIHNTIALSLSTINACLVTLDILLLWTIVGLGFHHKGYVLQVISHDFITRGTSQTWNQSRHFRCNFTAKRSVHDPRFAQSKPCPRIKVPGRWRPYVCPLGPRHPGNGATSLHTERARGAPIEGRVIQQVDHYRVPSQESSTALSV